MKVNLSRAAVPINRLGGIHPPASNITLHTPPSITWLRRQTHHPCNVKQSKEVEILMLFVSNANLLRRSSLSDLQGADLTFSCPPTFGTPIINKASIFPRFQHRNQHIIQTTVVKADFLKAVRISNRKAVSKRLIRLLKGLLICSKQDEWLF